LGKKGKIINRTRSQEEDKKHQGGAVKKTKPPQKTAKLNCRKLVNDNYNNMAMLCNLCDDINKEIYKLLSNS